MRACVCVCVVVVELCVCVWLCGCGGRLVLWVSMNGMTLQHTLLHKQTHQSCITLMQEQDKYEGFCVGEAEAKAMSA